MIFVWVALLIGAAGAKAVTTETLVLDTLYRADGSVAQGTITIRWDDFVTSAGQAVAAGQKTWATDKNGGISIPLIPNTGSTPSGSYYRAVIKKDDGTTKEQIWVVPAVTTTTLAAVWAKVVPQAVAAQSASRDYVDTELAEVVHLAGTETIEGAKTFVPSPQVPAPTAAGGAANKGYVDQAISGLATVASTGNYNDLLNKPASANLASPGAIGSITPGPVNATAYAVNGAPLASGNLSDGALLARTSTTINGYPISSNVTLSASNLTMGALPNGTTATTQAANDDSTRLATTQFVVSALATAPAIGSTSPGPVNATAYAVNGAPLASGNLSDGALLVRYNAVNTFTAVQSMPSLILSSLGTGTSPVCPNGTGGALTTAGCSGGGSSFNPAVPGAIGATTPSTGNFTALAAQNVIPSATPVIDLRAYGGDPTMTTDSSTAVYNAAVASCAAYSSLNVTVPIYVSPGKYLINNVNLTGLSCVPMFYGLDDNSTWFYYNGNTSAGYNANGVPESLIQFGSAGFGGFEGIGFNGVNQTTGAMATHLLWLTQGVDNGFRIAHSRFSQAVQDGVHEQPLIYSGNATFTASSTTVSMPSCSTAGLSNGQTVWLYGVGSAGVAGQDLSTTISSTANCASANTITVANAPNATITGTGIIAAGSSLGFVNWHMDHIRFDGIGRSPVYITGSSGDENRPFTMENFTVSTVAPTGGLANIWLTNAGLFNGTNWGGAVVTVNNGLGTTIALTGGRVELSSPQIVIGNLDNGALVNSLNEVSGGALVVLNNVVGYSSPLDEPIVASASGKAQLVMGQGSAFVANGAIKNVATQAFYGDKYAAQSTAYNWGNAQTAAIAIGARGQVPQQIDSVIDPNSSASYRRFSANDIVGHPASEAISGGYSGGKAGPFRYVSATGDINGTITKSGRCQGAAANLTTNATINGTTTVSIPSISTLWIQPGDNITIVNGNGSGINLDTQIVSVNYTANTMVVANAPSASGSGYTIQNQACTFHEFAGAQTGTAAPTTGWWFANEKVWNTNTASGQPIYWVNTASGNPGTWVAGPTYGTTTGLSLDANGTPVTPVANVINIAPGLNTTVTSSGNNITIASTGAGSGVAYGYCTGVAGPSSTYSLYGLGAGANTTCSSGAATVAGVLMTTAGTASNLSVVCGTGGVNSSSGVFTIYDAPDNNGTLVTTPVTVTYGTSASNSLVQDLTDTYTYAKGDRLLVKYTTQASETLGNCTVSFNYSQAGTSGSAVTSVTASTPLASSGGLTPNITIQQASGAQAGYLASTDWTTFNNKQAAIGYTPADIGSCTAGQYETGDTASGPTCAQVSAANLTGTLPHAQLPALVSGDIPNNAANTTGTAANVTGTVAIANGGTGQTTQQAAINALTGTQAAGTYLRSNGTNASLSALQLSDTAAVNSAATGFFLSDGRLGITSANGASNVSVAVANNVYVCPFVMPLTFTIGHAAINVNAGATGASENIGIYSMAGNKLVDTGAMPATGYALEAQAVSTGATLTAGTPYFIAWAGTSTTPTVGSFTVNTTWVGLLNNLMGAGHGCGSAANILSSGSLPATLGTVTNGTVSYLPVVIWAY